VSGKVIKVHTKDFDYKRYTTTPAEDDPRSRSDKSEGVRRVSNMNAKLVSSIDAVARSRLATIGLEASLVDVAKRLSDTQIALVVVCDSDATMAGVITETDIVRQIGRCGEGACTTAAVDLMTRDVSYCRPTDSLLDVLSMMEKRGFVHVPVIDEKSRPSGVVNARDALRALMAEEKYEASLLRDYVMGIGYR
jgi:CBS domain-containing protein